MATYPREGFVTAEDGVRLYFQRIGDGPGTLLIPNGPPYLNDFQYLASNRTVILFDVRNRGRSDSVTDTERLKRGIHQDVDDLDAVRRHFESPQVDLLTHSYVGLVAILYAMKNPARVNRVVQVGAVAPDAATEYPPELTANDATRTKVLTELGEFLKQPPSADPEQRCREFWSILRPLYVVNPADVHRLDGWQRCHLPNERQGFAYFNGSLLPSIRALKLTALDLSRVTMPVLGVHGRRDRSAPYGGGRDWARLLPNARLVTLDDAGHVPWIEAPEEVFGAIQTFLDGAWPQSAARIS